MAVNKNVNEADSGGSKKPKPTDHIASHKKKKGTGKVKVKRNGMYADDVSFNPDMNDAMNEGGYHPGIVASGANKRKAKPRPNAKPEPVHDTKGSKPATHKKKVGTGTATVKKTKRIPGWAEAPDFSGQGLNWANPGGWSANDERPLGFTGASASEGRARNRRK